MFAPFRANSALSAEDLVKYETMTVVGSTAVISWETVHEKRIFDIHTIPTWITPHEEKTA